MRSPATPACDQDDRVGEGEAVAADLADVCVDAAARDLVASAPAGSRCAPFAMLEVSTQTAMRACVPCLETALGAGRPAAVALRR